MATADKHKKRSARSHRQGQINMQHLDQYTVWRQEKARTRDQIANAVSTLLQAKNPSRDRGQ